ncbi:MAG: 5'-methylthioadenosine/S-adenosylhomocysteine nucleosidase [Burkholderiales bacterium RIFCSPLOWO2_02_FULL_57_36]|nr:MAG: 5'-methylthioadenosine/S-adenosylhomocysteine nucleosidase [Burkholderiales bacterium RIFCSPLOWO2_02_FULL_57_36]
MTSKAIRLGIISAVQEEQAGLIESMQDTQTLTRGMRHYISGRLWDTDCICVLSRMGKVAAAATAAMLIERFDVSHIIFTGVAGSADPDICVGDLVIATHLVQHDMDASPLFPRFEIPLTGLSRFSTDAALSARLAVAGRDFLSQDFQAAIDSVDREKFRHVQPRLHHGLIASGDEFVSSRARLLQLKQGLPDLLAVEMEGAAVAQVCHEFGIPFAIIRTISDDADESSAVDFMRFIEKVAARYAFHVVRRFCHAP